MKLTFCYIILISIFGVQNHFKIHSDVLPSRYFKLIPWRAGWPGNSYLLHHCNKVGSAAPGVFSCSKFYKMQNRKRKSTQPEKSGWVVALLTTEQLALVNYLKDNAYPLWVSIVSMRYKATKQLAQENDLSWAPHLMLVMELSEKLNSLHEENKKGGLL